MRYEKKIHSLHNAILLFGVCIIIFHLFNHYAWAESVKPGDTITFTVMNEPNSDGAMENVRAEGLVMPPFVVKTQDFPTTIPKGGSGSLIFQVNCTAEPASGSIRFQMTTQMQTPCLICKPPTWDQTLALELQPCDDENPCTEDTCDPATGQCEFEEKDCDDEDPCTTDSCDPDTGECKHEPACDDDNECTDDFCDPQTGECRHEEKELDPCQVCKDKKIVPKCDDDNECTEDHCDPQTGECSYTDVELDQCHFCENKKIVEKDCDDHNECTEDSCDPNTGECHHTLKQLSICEICRDSRIVNKCDDDNECTQDICDPTTGACDHQPVELSRCQTCRNNRIVNLCDDNNECTIDHCDSETGACSHEPVELNRCQQCVNGTITSIDCNDGDSCTIDSCQPETGCSHQPDPNCDTDNPDPTYIQYARISQMPSVIEAKNQFSSLLADESHPLSLIIQVPKPSIITMIIFDDQGKQIRLLIHRQYYPKGPHEIPWDGNDDSGNKVPEGVYQALINGVHMQNALDIWTYVEPIIIDNTAPVADISVVFADQPAMDQFTIHGTAQDDHFKWLYVSCFNESEYKYVTFGQYPVQNNFLAQLNSNDLPNGSYTLRLEVKDHSGNKTTVDKPLMINHDRPTLMVYVNNITYNPDFGSDGYVPTSDDPKVWIEDQVPDGATLIDSWEWSEDHSYSGELAHAHPPGSGVAGHYFIHADSPLCLSPTENIIQYVYLDSSTKQIMLQFYTDSGNGEHRVYWGDNLIPTDGIQGTESLYSMGKLPHANQWIRLKIPAVSAGLVGKCIKGMAFITYNGNVLWDKTTKSTDYNETQKTSWINASNIGTDNTQAITFHTQTSHHATIQLSVYDLSRQLIRTVFNDYTEAGSHTFSWDGMDSNGVQVADGSYIFEFTSPEFEIIHSNTWGLISNDLCLDQPNTPDTQLTDSSGNIYEIINHTMVQKSDNSNAPVYSITQNQINPFVPVDLTLDENQQVFIINGETHSLIQLNPYGYIMGQLPLPVSSAFRDTRIIFNAPTASLLSDDYRLMISQQDQSNVCLGPARGMVTISNITANIRIPYDQSLLYAYVPIIGTATARNFKKFEVAYGFGENPTQWEIINTSYSETFDDFRPLPGVRTIYGNLATLHVSNQPYDRTGGLPMGLYTIRLRVYNQALNYQDDMVHVVVGRVIGRWGGQVTSNDGMVTLTIPNGAISDDNDVFAIETLTQDQAPAVNDPDVIPVGNIYCFKPAGYSFLKSCTLSMTYTDEQVGDLGEHTLKIYRWQPLTHRWIFVYADLKTSSNTLTTTLTEFNDYAVYYAVMSDPPPAPVIYQTASPTPLKTITLYGKASPSVTVELFVNDITHTTVQADQLNGAFVFPFVRLQMGSNVVKAQASDPVGNTSPFSEPVLIDVVASQPKSISYVQFMTESFDTLNNGTVCIGDTLYIELTGIDADPSVNDAIMVNLSSQISYPEGIQVQLIETEVNSGVYRGLATVGTTLDASVNQINVSSTLSEIVIVKSLVAPDIIDQIETQDKIPPPAPELFSTTHPSLCQNTFEIDLDEWQNMSQSYGATVNRIQDRVSTGLYAAQLVNTEEGGDFACFVRKTPFDARHFPLLQFDYAISSDVKLNLIAYVNGMWKEIQFTDDAKTVETFGDDLYRAIGAIPNIQADNAWHHAMVNLYSLLKNDDPDQLAYIIEELYFADTNLPGWMELSMGHENKANATWFVDNVIISSSGQSNNKPKFLVSTDDESVVSVCYVLDTQSDTVPNPLSHTQITLENGRTTIQFPVIHDGQWMFHARLLDYGGNWGPTNHYQIRVDTTGPVADSPNPAQGHSSGDLSMSLHLTDNQGSGVDPDSIELQVNDVIYKMDSGGLAYDVQTGILTFSLWKVSPKAELWENGDEITAKLLVANDYAGNAIQTQLTWTWTVDYAEHAGGYLSLLTTQGGFTPSWSPDASHLAFMSERNGQQDIWIMASDDYAELRHTSYQLTMHEASDHHPDWSPIDSRIAFVSDRDGYNHIYIGDANAAQITQMTFGTEHDSHPSWSPDAQYIAFSRNDEIWALDVKTAIVTQLTFNSIEYYLEPAWSPDGKTIAFTKSLYVDEIAVMDVNGTNQQVITTSGADTQPCWSWQTPTLIFVSQPNQTPGVVKSIHQNGSNELLYLDNLNQFWDTEPDIAPLDDLIAFQSTRNGTWNIWVKTRLACRITHTPDLISPNMDDHADALVFDITLTSGAGHGSLIISDLDHQPIITLLDKTFLAEGYTQIFWNAQLQDQTIIPDGQYQYVFMIEGVSGANPITQTGQFISDSTAPQFTSIQLTSSWLDPIQLTASIQDASPISLTILQYGIASTEDQTIPDIIGWQDVSTEQTGTLHLKWEAYGSYYLYVRGYASDIAGNADYSKLVIKKIPSRSQGPVITPIPDQTILEDTSSGPIALTITDSDTPLDSLFIHALSSQPNLIPFDHIVVTQNNSITVTPLPNQFGQALITIIASDGALTATTSFYVTVKSVNDPPSINPISNLTLMAGTVSTPIPITVFDSDDTLSVFIQSDNHALFPQTAMQLISITDQLWQLTITPEPHQAGKGILTVFATDGDITVTTAFQVTVQSSDEPPVISGLHDLTMPEDTESMSLAITVTDADTDISKLNVAIHSSNIALIPNNRLSIDRGDVWFIVMSPLPDQSGQTTISLAVSDGSITTTQFCMITVTPVNDSPEIEVIQKTTTLEDTAALPIAITIWDRDNLASQLELSVQSDNQTLLANSMMTISGTGNIRWLNATPQINQYGTAHILIQVNDGEFYTSTTLEFIVTAVNDSPTIVCIDAIQTSEDIDIQSIPVKCIDPDDDSLSVQVLTDNPELFPQTGLVLTGQGKDRTLSVSLAENQYGQGTILLSVSDSQITITHMILITVDPVNDSPLLTHTDKVTLQEDTVSSFISIKGYDEDDDQLSLTVHSLNHDLIDQTGLTVSGQANNWTLFIMPMPNQYGQTDVLLSLTDGNLTTTSQIKVQINAVNDSPEIAQLKNQVIAEDSAPVTLTFMVTDQDGDALQVYAQSNQPLLIPEVIVSQSTDPNSWHLTFYPGKNLSGQALITVWATDHQITDTTQISITVSPVNDAPVIMQIQPVTLKEDTQSETIELQISDVDHAMNQLNITALSFDPSLFSQQGIIIQQEGDTPSLTLVPMPNQWGQTTIRIRVSDGELSALMSFDVNVEPVNDSPILSQINSISIMEDNTGVLPYTVWDLETLASNLVISYTTQNRDLFPQGTITSSGLDQNRQLHFSPAPNKTGLAVITLTVSDGEKTANRYFSVTVLPVNDPPAIYGTSSISMQMNEQSKAITFTVSDNETMPEHLMVNGKTSNELLIPSQGIRIQLGEKANERVLLVSPNTNQSGQATLFVTVSDAEGLTGIAMISIEVIGDSTLDSDHDGIPDQEDAFPDDPNEWLDTDHDSIGNQADQDDDGDGMPDDWEIRYGFNPLIDDAYQDQDGDGISNYLEYVNGSHPNNHPPDQPILESPVNGLEEVSVTPLLMASSFYDPDGEHLKTRWIILTQPIHPDDLDTLIQSPVVFDQTTELHLLQIKIPSMILQEGMRYYWRVQYMDDDQDTSIWSEANSFTTLIHVTSEDDNQNGVPDQIEASTENLAIRPDQDETAVKCFYAINDLGVMGVQKSTHVVSVDKIAVIDPEEIESSDTKPVFFPMGLISYKATLDTLGADAHFIIYMSKPAPDNATWYKYDSINGWQDFSSHTTMSDDRLSLEIIITDGGFGDSDGVVNGVVIDPGGLGTMIVPNPIEEECPGCRDVNTCFIDMMIDYVGINVLIVMGLVLLCLMMSRSRRVKI